MACNVIAPEVQFGVSQGFRLKIGQPAWPGRSRADESSGSSVFGILAPMGTGFSLSRRDTGWPQITVGLPVSSVC